METAARKRPLSHITPDLTEAKPYPALLNRTKPDPTAPYHA